MTAFNERLIRILDEELLPDGNKYLSGRLGIIVIDLRGSYHIIITSKDSPLITAERLQHLTQHLKVDPFTDMDVKIYLDELVELRDRNLWILQFHIFVKEKEEK